MKERWQGTRRKFDHTTRIQRIPEATFALRMVHCTFLMFDFLKKENMKLSRTEAIQIRWEISDLVLRRFSKEFSGLK